MRVLTMHVAQPFFDMIASGAKDIECRLNDDKRRTIKIGDTVMFYNDDRQIFCRVVDLLLSPDFAHLFARVNIRRTGLHGITNPSEFMERFYSADAQNQYGVVGIVVTRIP